MIIKHLLLVCAMAVCGISYGQNSGFIGKKNILSVDGRFSMPLFYSLSKSERSKYKADGDQFKPAKNLVSSGINLTLGRTLSNTVAFLLQGSMTRYKIYAPSYGALTDDQGNTEFLSFSRTTFLYASSIGIMPIFEFAGADGILPVGLSHQVGLGFYKHKLLKKDYLMLPNNNFYSKDLYTTDDVIAYDKISVKSYSLMYKLNLRLPLSRSLLLNMGIRYNLNFTPNVIFLSSNPIGNTFYSPQDFGEMVRGRQRRNFIWLETGLSLAF